MGHHRPFRRFLRLGSGRVPRSLDAKQGRGRATLRRLATWPAAPRIGAAGFARQLFGRRTRSEDIEKPGNLIDQFLRRFLL
jgi:hypothetical protein